MHELYSPTPGVGEMRAGGGQRGGEDPADLRARLPPEGVAGAAPQHARPHRLGHRPVQDLQGGKKGIKDTP